MSQHNYNYTLYLGLRYKLAATQHNAHLYIQASIKVNEYNMVTRYG